MKTVALISGGKDSCYNMMQCISEGHSIDALANLKPKDKDELDSYMYQSVGHHAIDLYAEAMGLPLYRREIQGVSKSTERDYEPTEEDEVEDLYELLKTVKDEMQVEAVSVGAILSNYQRVRVENVCQRLGLVPLAYLWRRDQVELLDEMIDCQLVAVLIKVAALGLQPKQHLGKTLSDMKEHLHKKNAEFELNVCGEGGEYETFTLDCPLFQKRIVLDETEMVIHSEDAFAPVGYLNLRKAHLEDKHVDSSLNQKDLIKDLPIKSSQTVLDEVFPNRSELRCVNCEQLQGFESRDTIQECREPKIVSVKSRQSDRAGLWATNIKALTTDTEDVTLLAKQTMDKLKELIEPLTMSELVLVHLYVKNMADFAAINSVYKTYFGINPAARVCVEAALPENVSLMLDCYVYGCHGNRDTMHVQGLSHWAPANIGPYSQCVKIGNLCYVAGQIGMVPANLTLIEGGIHAQARLSLRHVERVLAAMYTGCSLDDVTTCVCYVTHPQYIQIAVEELDSHMKDYACVPVYVVVPQLPKGALIEWQVIARTDIAKPLQVSRSTRCLESLYTAKAKSIQTADLTPLSAAVSVYKTENVDSENVDLRLVLDLLNDIWMTLDNRTTENIEFHTSFLRFFYPAHVFKFDDLSNALEKQFKDHPIAIVPVTHLETKDAVLTVCQTFN